MPLTTKKWITTLFLTFSQFRTSDAFTTPTSQRILNSCANALPPLSMSDDSFPSDSSSESVVDVQSKEYEPSESEQIITSILDSLPSNIGDSDSGPLPAVSKETRATINEYLLKLEAVNPTEQSVSSSLLNGVWSLRYAGGYDEDWALPSPTRQLALFLYSGGYSPGLFALRLASTLPSNLVETGDLEISISREQPRIEAKIDVTLLGGTSNSVEVKARLDIQSSEVRMKETYEAATVLGQSIDLPQALQYSRDLYVTYLDEEILIVRDGSGVPELLLRKQ